MASSSDNKTNVGGNKPDRAEATKRLAQKGQWQTPPLPTFATTNAAVYAASAGGDTTTTTTNPATAAAAIVAGNTLPTTPDEYARMLQEAYQRGAEAGARSRTQQQTIGTANNESAAAVPPSYMPPHPTQTTTAMGGVGINTIATAVGGANPDIQVSGTNYATLPPAVQSSSMKITMSNSVSMPDMSSYHHHNQSNQNSNQVVDNEDDKRKKRLARNRASARLRRLKKKNLVDSYEGEVGILESSLSKLRSHMWGNNTNNVVDDNALIEALSMERGQQPLTSEKRKELIQSIVMQQREQVGNLLECQLENWILCQTAAAANNDNEGKVNDEMAEVTSELQSLLQLTPEQCARINQSSVGCDNEVQDLFTVDSCLQSIHLNQWLLDGGVDEVAEPFTSILNPTQQSKFLLWSDHNTEQIESLDYVNVQLAGEGGGPVFEFGVDEGLTGDD